VEVVLDQVDVDRQAQQLADGLKLATSDVEHLSIGAAGALAFVPAS
jgi:hypothetical protein